MDLMIDFPGAISDSMCSSVSRRELIYIDVWEDGMRSCLWSPALTDIPWAQDCFGS